MQPPRKRTRRTSKDVREWRTGMRAVNKSLITSTRTPAQNVSKNVTAPVEFDHANDQVVHDEDNYDFQEQHPEQLNEREDSHQESAENGGLEVSDNIHNDDGDLGENVDDIQQVHWHNDDGDLGENVDDLQQVHGHNDDRDLGENVDDIQQVHGHNDDGDLGENLDDFQQVHAHNDDGDLGENVDDLQQVHGESLGEVYDSEDERVDSPTWMDDLKTDEDVSTYINLILRKCVSAKFFLSIILLYGQIRFSIKQYELLSILLNSDEKNDLISSHSTVRQRVWPFYCSRLFVTSTEVRLPANIHFKMATVRAANDEDDEELFSEDSMGRKTCLKSTLIVRPSDWARIDVSTYQVAKDLYPETFNQIDSSNDNDQTNAPTRNSFQRVRDSNIIKNSTEYMKPDRLPTMMTNESGLFAKPHDLINFFSVEDPSDDDSINTQHWTFQEVPGEKHFSFNGIISAVWIAGSQSDDSSCTVPSKCIPSISQIPIIAQKVIDRLESYIESPVDENLSNERHLESKLSWSIHPADLCTLVIPECDGSPSRTRCEMDSGIGSIAVVVNRFWRSRNSEGGDFVIWFNVTSADQEVEPVFISASPKPPLVLIPADFDSTNQENSWKLCGKLDDCTPYYVYRFLLYCDDFLPRSALFPRGSVGGCYIRPVDFSMEVQRCASSIRPISLTPTGMSTNFVIDHIIDDILIGTQHGFQVVDCLGNKAVVFLQMVGFVADYPASSYVLDVMNHNSRSPCTHCTFRYKTIHSTDKTDKSDLRDKCYSHDTTSTYANPSYRRGLFRTLALRTTRLTHEQSTYLGMQDGELEDISKPGKWPLLKLCVELDKLTRRPRLDELGNKVVPGKIDPYCCNIVAPDHCITGLIKGLLHLCFKETPDVSSDKTMVLKLELMISCTLRDIGIPGHTTIYNETNGVVSLSMSTLYAISSILPLVLRSLSLDNLTCFDLILQMNKLVNLTFRWPTSEQFDDDYSLIHGDRINKYHQTLCEMAVEYVNTVYIYGRSHPQYRGFIDRPNTHRLLEIYHHSIPLFGHALFIAEMTFEQGHVPLKNSISRNTNPNSHISAVKHTLCRDWLRRIADLWQVQKRTVQKDELMYIRRNMRRLFCGLDVECMVQDEQQLSALLNQIDEAITEVMESSAGRLLEIFYSTPLYRQNVTSSLGYSTKQTRKWTPIVGRSKVSGSVRLARIVMKQWQIEGLKFFNERLSPIFNNIQGTLFSKLILKAPQTSRHYSHNTLVPGDVVAAYVRRGTEQCKIVDSYECVGENSPPWCKSYFLIRCLLGTSDHNIWASVKTLQVVHETSSLYVLPKVTHEDTQFMEIRYSVRKCAVVHACQRSSGCIINFNKRSITHSIVAGHKSYFYIMSETNGFPPRRA